MVGFCPRQKGWKLQVVIFIDYDDGGDDYDDDDDDDDDDDGDENDDGISGGRSSNVVGRMVDGGGEGGRTCPHSSC